MTEALNERMSEGTGRRWSAADFWLGESCWPALLDAAVGDVVVAKVIAEYRAEGGDGPVGPVIGVCDDAVNGWSGHLITLQRGVCFLAYHKYVAVREIAQRVRQLRPADEVHDFLLADTTALIGARVGQLLSISQRAAEVLVEHADVMHERVPKVFEQLRQGRIVPELVSVVVACTELLDGCDTAAAVDAEVAEELARHGGAWSRAQLATMVDRIVFRHDPDAVRERCRRAGDKRSVIARPRPDGMASITATMTAENVAIAMAGISRLADAVCAEDPRTRRQRSSDACFALLSGTAFECLCGRGEECTAVIPEAGTVPPAAAAVMVHVVCDEATYAAAEEAAAAERVAAQERAAAAERAAAQADSVSIDVEDVSTEGASGSGRGVQQCVADGEPAESPAEPSTAEQSTVDGELVDGAAASGANVAAAQSDTGDGAGDAPAPAGSAAFIFGQGVVSDVQAFGLITRPDAVVRRLIGRHVVVGPDGGIEVSATAPGNPYRPSSVLDRFVRIRDGWTVTPGEDRSAMSAEVDHVAEFDHRNPGAGGATVPDNLNAKSRFAHLLKTFGAGWLDEQYRDPGGRLRTEFLTPEGMVILGNPFTLEDLFPGLARIRFRAPPTPPAAPAPTDAGPAETARILHPTRRMSRVEAKHARRRQERERNKRRREAQEHREAQERGQAVSPVSPAG
ncbi:DUF222 domain-containing protein [Gordonia sp. VNQ95]|uniref:DUF222 domain-containing protein n=1 Tax=Gordonia sp. VNQ95 TaxID=3156619 RepID=UPI0032B5EA63